MFYQTKDVGKLCVLYSAHLLVIHVVDLVPEPLTNGVVIDTDDSDCHFPYDDGDHEYDGPLQGWI